MIRLFLCALAVLVVPSVSLSADISIKMSEIPAGSWFLMKSNAGESMHVFRGKKGRYYIYDFVPGTDPNAPRHFRDLRTADGNTVKRILLGGNTLEFTPHNCRRVVGRCEYTETGLDKNGAKYRTKMVRINSPSGKGFTYEQFAVADTGEQVPIQKGKVAGLDSKGMLLSASMTRASDGRSLKFKKLRASWD